MTPLLLRLAGIDTAPGETVVSMALHLRNQVQLPWVIAGALILAFIAWRSYRHADLPLRNRSLLTGLRTAALLLLLAILLRPILAATVESGIRRTLLILTDRSASMNIQDPRTTDEDLHRAGIAMGKLDPTRGLDQKLDSADAGALRRISRVDTARAVLENPRLDLLTKLARDCELEPWTFGTRTEPLFAPAATSAPAADASPVPSQTIGGTTDFGWTKELTAADKTTALGDAVRALLDRKRGQAVAGIFILTDGASNTGAPPLDAATTAGRDGIPLFLYGVGLTSPQDVIVANVFGPEIAFADEEVPVNVRVRSQGLPGRTAKLVLRLGEESVGEQEVTLTAEGEQLVPMKFTPKTKGELELSAAIEPIEGETLTDNNRVAQKLRVVDDKIKVLLVEQAPRWEFQHLQAVLLRDRRVELKMVLVEGDPGLSKAENSPYLPGFPREKEALYAFDLVVIGDLDPKTLDAADFEHLGEFVSKFGGALLFLAGKRHNPLSYARTELEKMLPVELPDSASPETPGPFGFELTAAGRRSPLLKLSGPEEESAAQWSRLPPLQWISPVGRAKPAAEVLLTESATGDRSGDTRRPILAIQQYGVGQVLFVGSDNLWRWRRNEGAALHTNLWTRLVQRLALPHLLGGSKRTQLTADKEKYAAGDRVTLYARLYSDAFEPMRDPVVDASVSTGEGTTAARRDIQLRPVPDQPGMYRGEFVATTTGLHRFGVGHDAATHLDFDVSEPRFESGESAMNERLLRSLADRSNGAFLREEDLHRLPSMLADRNERVRSVIEAEIWSSPILFLLVLALLTTEWILRKRWHLR